MKSKGLKGTATYQLITEWIKFVQQYGEMESEEDAQVVVDEADRLVKKFAGTDAEPYTQKLVLLHVEVLDEKYQERRKNGT